MNKDKTTTPENLPEQNNNAAGAVNKALGEENKQHDGHKQPSTEEGLNEERSQGNAGAFEGFEDAEKK